MRAQARGMASIGGRARADTICPSFLSLLPLPFLPSASSVSVSSVDNKSFAVAVVAALPRSHAPGRSSAAGALGGAREIGA